MSPDKIAKHVQMPMNHRMKHCLKNGDSQDSGRWSSLLFPSPRVQRSSCLIPCAIVKSSRALVGLPTKVASLKRSRSKAKASVRSTCTRFTLDAALLWRTNSTPKKLYQLCLRHITKGHKCNRTLVNLWTPLHSFKFIIGKFWFY